MSNFFELITLRESCRNYNANKPVEKDKLGACIEAARLAPSACNSQPWHFTVVNSPNLQAEMANCLQELGMNKFTDACPAFIVINEEKVNLSSRLGGMVKSQDYAQIDIGIAATHICLAASAQGLSTCILGCFHENKLKELLNMPKNKRIRLVICVGYAENDTIRTKIRKPKEEIVSFVE